MRRLRLLPLLFPVLLVAAICVTDVRRLSDVGPWVGEFTNYRAETVGFAYVESSIIDADGRTFTYAQGRACPGMLAPGESAAFELSIQPASLDPRYVSPLPRPPFRLGDGPRIEAFVIPPEEMSSAYTRNGFKAEVIRRDAAQKFLLAEVQNSSILTMQDTTVCAVVRTPSGAVLAVGEGRAAPSTMRPGVSDVIPVLFRSSLPTGEVTLFVEGRPTAGFDCCTADVPVEGALSISASKIVDLPDGSFLYMVGELRNTTDLDLSGYSVTAHLDDSWIERVDGAGLGCDGPLGRGDTVPFAILFSVNSSETERQITIEGIDAIREGPYYKPLVSDVRVMPATKKEGFLVESREVTFTLTNESSSWLRVLPACIGLRNADGKLVGATYMTPADHLAPGASITATIDVEQLAGSTTADVIAYAQPLLTPPQP